METGKKQAANIMTRGATIQRYIPELTTIYKND
jgi:hypothetical protein